MTGRGPRGHLSERTVRAAPRETAALRSCVSGCSRGAARPSAFPAPAPPSPACDSPAILGLRGSLGCPSTHTHFPLPLLPSSFTWPCDLGACLSLVMITDLRAFVKNSTKLSILLLFTMASLAFGICSRGAHVVLKQGGFKMLGQEPTRS